MWPATAMTYVTAPFRMVYIIGYIICAAGYLGWHMIKMLMEK
jgi:hypothetical protein